MEKNSLALEYIPALDRKVRDERFTYQESQTNGHRPKSSGHCLRELGMFVEKPESLRSISCLYLLPMSLYCIPTVYIYIYGYLSKEFPREAVYNCLGFD